MRLKYAQLNNHLNRQGLTPLYLLTGDEPLQMMECADTLRAFARKQGFTERVVLTVETGFDWEDLEEQTDSFSLFANKRLLEIRLGNKSPDDKGTKVLIAYSDKPPSNTVLLIIADKVESKKQKNKWFKTLDERGVVIQIWPLNVSDLPGWIVQRMRQYGLQASPDAINMIAERAEGHLLACAQEIEKLHLLYGASYIDTAQVLEAVADSARFEVFNWVESVLAGDVRRCVRQLLGLREVAPALVLWALNREIRNLCHITYAIVHMGQQQDQLFNNYRIWATRRNAMSRAINRYSQPLSWQRFLRHTARIERMIKGVESGNPWDELQRLSLQMAGVKLFSGVKNP
ncbi:MAG: DNA polymerase III subunit delta [Pseudomonadota bacterium]